MQKITLLLGGIFFTSALYAQALCKDNGLQVSLSENGVCNHGPYILVFEDHFDGSSLDLTKWAPVTGVTRDENHENEKQWYSPDNIVFENGILDLQARKKSLENQCFSIWTGAAMEDFCQDFDYSSAEIDSRYKFGHGIFEIRCKIPKGKGFFPAFWTYGGAKWNEIDVFEFWNENDVFDDYDPSKLSKVHKMNAHYDYDGDGNHLNCPVKYTGPDFSQDFHTFTLIWTPHKIEWYVDGDLKLTTALFYTILGQSVDCNGLQAFHQYILNKAFPREPMNIIANLAIQSLDEAPDESTPFPSSLEIDYIRYYKQIDDCNANITIETLEDLNLADDVYNVIVGNNITISSNVVFDASDQLTVIASDNITIDENSILEGNIETIIDPFFCSHHQLVRQEEEVELKEDQYPQSRISPDTSHQFKVSPNPFENELSIDMKGTKPPYKILIFDLIGNPVFAADVENTNTLELNISHLQSGAYLLYIFDGKGDLAASRKIFKS